MDTLTASELPAVPRPHPTRMGVLLRLLGAAIAGLALGAAVVALVATQFLGFHVLGLASDSMAPRLHRGDLVFTRPVPITSVASGDVVAYDEGEQTRVTVVHRVAGIINVTVNSTDSKTGHVTTQATRLLQTRGDANPSLDGQPVGADRLRGLVFLTVPGLGDLLGGMQLQAILIGIALVTGVLWLSYEIRRWRHRRTRTG